MGILGTKIVLEGCQHRDESVTPICQGKNAEVVEDICSVGDCREQPIEVVLINSLREECDDSEKPSGVGAEFLKHRGGQ